MKGTWLPMVLVASALIALAAWAALAGPALADDANHVSAGSVTVEPGASGSVDISADAPDGDLGAWNIDVDYDSAVISVDSCDEGSIGLNLCNDAFGPTTVRIVGADAGGADGALTMATINFTAVGAVGDCTDLTVTVIQFADPTGNETDPTVTNGEVCIEDAAVETDAPEPDPTATPADLPDTGGALAGGSNSAAYLLGILGLAVIASGAFVVSRTRRTEI